MVERLLYPHVGHVHDALLPADEVIEYPFVVRRRLGAREYLIMVEREASIRQAAGMSASDAAADIALGEYGEWGDWGRIAVNVETVFASGDKAFRRSDIVELFARMAALERGGRVQ